MPSRIAEYRASPLHGALFTMRFTMTRNGIALMNRRSKYRFLSAVAFAMVCCELAAPVRSVPANDTPQTPKVIPILILKMSEPSKIPARPTEVDHGRSKYFPPFLARGQVASCDWCACAYYQMTYTLNAMVDRTVTPQNTFSPKFGFTFDLTDLSTAAPNTGPWFFRLANAGSQPATVKSFKIIDVTSDKALTARSLPQTFSNGEAIVFIHYPH